MISKFAGVALASVMLAGTAAYAASDTGAVKETVLKWVKVSNAGDAAGAAALQAPQASVIDEFAPFRWVSFNDWGSAYGAYVTQNGLAHIKSKLLGFSQIHVEGEHAYVVAKASFTYTEQGKARKESGAEALTLEKQSGAWQIASFAWMGKGGVDEGADATAIMDTVHRFTSMSGTPAPAPSAVVDDFAPYRWTGPTAYADWNSGVQKLFAQAHTSDVALKLGSPDQLSVNNDKGYVVVPALVTGKSNGKMFTGRGQFAFALDKNGGTWQITSLAWAMR